MLFVFDKVEITTFGTFLASQVCGCYYYYYYYYYYNDDDDGDHDDDDDDADDEVLGA